MPQTLWLYMYDDILSNFCFAYEVLCILTMQRIIELGTTFLIRQKISIMFENINPFGVEEVPKLNFL